MMIYLKPASGIQIRPIEMYLESQGVLSLAKVHYMSAIMEYALL